MTKNKVALRPAYEWTCDDCGRSHYGTPSVATAYEIFDTLRRRGMEIPDDMVPDDWIVLPIRVKCPDCGSEFETEGSSTITG